MDLKKIVYFSAAILGTMAVGATTASASHASRVVKPRVTNVKKPAVRAAHHAKVLPNHEILGHVYRQKNGTYMKAMDYSNKYISKYGNPYNQPDSSFRGYSDYLNGSAGLWNKPSIKKGARRVASYRRVRQLAKEGVPFTSLAETDLVNPHHDKVEGTRSTAYYLLQSMNHRYMGWVIDTGAYSDSQAIVYPKRKARTHKVAKRTVRRRSTKRTNNVIRRMNRNKKALRKHARHHTMKRHAKRNSKRSMRKSRKYGKHSRKVSKRTKRVPVMKAHNSFN